MLGLRFLSSSGSRASLGVALLIPSLALAATYDVPADFTTVQAALVSATHGDEIIVAPGIYYETIRFEGKNLTLRSTNPEDPEVVAATILDASRTGTELVTQRGPPRVPG